MRTQWLYRMTVILWANMMILSVFSAVPDDGDNFYVFTNGNTRKAVYSLDQIDKLTFDEQSMSVWTNSGRIDYAYSNVSLMTFKDMGMVPDRVESIGSAARDITIHYDRTAGIVYVRGERLLSGVIIYDMLGKPVTKVLTKGKEYRCSLEIVPSGVYLVRVLDKETDTAVKIVK